MSLDDISLLVVGAISYGIIKEGKQEGARTLRAMLAKGGARLVSFNTDLL